MAYPEQLPETRIDETPKPDDPRKKFEELLEDGHSPDDAYELSQMYEVVDPDKED